MKALIVGLGSIGRRHLRVLRSIEPEGRITVWRQHSKRGESDEAAEADATVYSLETALAEEPEIAILANPAPYHIETALELATHGVHLLIEKPLSSRLDGINELIQLCRSRGLVLMVGYNLRFHEGLIALRAAIVRGRIGRLLSIRAEVGQYLADWRSGSDYRRGVSARAELGGGAVLELSHELDYVRWLCGEIESVSAWVGRVSELEIDVEDTAEILLQFKNGVIGSVHLDMVQRVPVRICRVVGTEGTLEWDGISGAVRLFKPGVDAPLELRAAGPGERDAMYRAELAHFLGCVSGQREPRITGEDGRCIVELALAIKQASRDQRWVKLPESHP